MPEFTKDEMDHYARLECLKLAASAHNGWSAGQVRDVAKCWSDFVINGAPAPVDPE